MKWLTFRTQHKPGFRLNLIDLLALAFLLLVSLVWRHFFPYQHLYLLPLYVFWSFFLFCNVFRIGNRWEIPWYLTFLALALYGYTRPRFPWMLLLAVCETLKWGLIVCRIVRGPYVGVLHKHVNAGAGWRKYGPPLVLCVLLALAFAGFLALAVHPGVGGFTDLIFDRPRSLADGRAHVWQYKRDGLVIARLGGCFAVVNEPQRVSTLSEIAGRHDGDYVINGSYFEANGEHAGWLWLDGRQIAPVKQDRQLTHVVRYDPRSGLMRFQSVGTFDPDGFHFPIEFQTGPMVVERNRIARDAIASSINGRGLFPRTLLGYTDEDLAVYFIITRQGASLVELAEDLPRRRPFRGKTLTVINLDGGGSTALHSRNHPDLDIARLSKLPWFLVAKPAEGVGR